MLIRDAAGRAGVNPQTLRYYERRGLLKPSGRRPSGYREYTPADVKVVRFVKRAQDLGFSLDDIEELLKLRQARSGQREAAQKIAQRHIDELEAKILDLQRMQGALSHLVSSCLSGTDPHCPIIEAFELGLEGDDDRR
jgi:Cu(I)-responsive transcriptional regulator